MSKCGIIGIYSREGSVAGDLYEGLLMLQHRGQDSAGMVTTDWDRFIEHKGNGLVRDVFKEEKVMKQLKGKPARLLIARVHSHSSQIPSHMPAHLPQQVQAAPAVRQTFVTVAAMSDHAVVVMLHMNNVKATCRELWPCSCAISDSWFRQQQGSTAVLRQLPAGHLPHPQWQPDQHGGAEGNAAVFKVFLQPHAANVLGLRGPSQCLC